MTKIVYQSYLANNEDYDIEYRVLEDGTEQINLWQHDDNTCGNGGTITEAEYLADWGTLQGLEMARRDAKAFTPHSFNLSNNTSTAPAVGFAAGSVISASAFDFETNYQIAEFATSNEVEITSLVLKALSPRGVTIPTLATKDGNRWFAAWELLGAGKFRLPNRPGDPLLVLSSQENNGELYEVHTDGGEQCSCPDFTFRGINACKHYLLGLILEASLAVYQTRQRQQAKRRPAKSQAA